MHYSNSVKLACQLNRILGFFSSLKLANYSKERPKWALMQLFLTFLMRGIRNRQKKSEFLKLVFFHFFQKGVHHHFFFKNCFLQIESLFGDGFRPIRSCFDQFFTLNLIHTLILKMLRLFLEKKNSGSFMFFCHSIDNVHTFSKLILLKCYQKIFLKKICFKRKKKLPRLDFPFESYDQKT